MLFWRIFGLIHWKHDFLVKNVTISERSTEILRKFVYLNKFERRKILRKIWICLNNFFNQTSEIGQILTKTIILLKMSHTQLNYALLLFWNIFGEFQGKLLFLVKNVTISERSTEILRKFVFLSKFEKGQIQRKIWICCKQPFWFKAVKYEIY